MSWLDDIQKDLQDAKQHPSRKKKDWEIERDIRLKDQAKDAGNAARIYHHKNKTGTYSFTDEQRSKYGSFAGKAGTKEQKAKAGSMGNSSPGGTVTGNRVHTCEYCGVSQKGNGFFRNHKNGKCLETKKENENIIKLHLKGLKAHEIVSELEVPMRRVRDVVQGYKRNSK